MYNVIELVKQYPEISLTIKASDLMEVIEKTVERAKAEFAPEQEETYLTVAEAAKMLDMDRSSLWRWNKSGYLLQIEHGGRRKYRMSDVKRILEGPK